MSNPLDPVYTVMAEEKGKFEEIGPVNGSKPSLLGNRDIGNKNPDLMRTKDIHGCGANSKGLGVFAHATRRED